MKNQLNLHFHGILLDGVYVRDAKGALRFRPVTPHTSDIEALVVDIATACESWLAKKGHGPDDEAPEPDADDGQAVIQWASLEGRQAVAGGRSVRKVRTVQVLGGRELAMPSRTAGCDGYNLHAGVGIGANEREALERLCRYVLRPPLGKERLVERDDGTIELGMKRAWSDGTTSLVFTPTELTEKLAALIPPPRANQILYHGVFGAHAAWRKEIVPPPAPERPEVAAARQAGKLVKGSTPAAGGPLTWAELLRRVFGVDGWECRTCHGRMRLRCVVVNPPATMRILDGLERATGPPPMT